MFTFKCYRWLIFITSNVDAIDVKVGFPRAEGAFS